MATTATKTTVGVFDTRDAAERCVNDLRTAGYREDQIGMVVRDASGRPTRVSGSGETYAEEGAAIGAVAGAASAAAIGAGMMAGVIPVIGPVLAVGPLAATLLNAAGGAAAGSLAGALVGWGFPEEEARYYEDEVKAGKYLVTVEGTSGATDPWGSMSRHGGYNRTYRLP
jgi:hypothetical protein